MERVIVDHRFPATNGVYKNLEQLLGRISWDWQVSSSMHGFRLAATAEFRTGHFIYNSVGNPIWFLRSRHTHRMGITANVLYSRILIWRSRKSRNVYRQHKHYSGYRGADFWTDGFAIQHWRKLYALCWFLEDPWNLTALWFPKSMAVRDQVHKAASLSVRAVTCSYGFLKPTCIPIRNTAFSERTAMPLDLRTVTWLPPSRYFGGAISLTF